MLYSFAALTPDQQSCAGGKAGTLAQLTQRGYPIPAGCVLLPEAFAGDEVKPEAWAQVQSYLAEQRQGRSDVAFAVRSSALAEDSAQASFAGEFKSVLDVCNDEDVRAAIQTVRRSRYAARVEAYGKAQGLTTEHEMAVIIQRMVRADFAGVLFTADPITGNLMQLTGNFVRGLGEQLVSGHANAQTFSIDQRSGRYSGPPELKRFARRLQQLAVRLDREAGTPQDIEWAIANGQVYILQARPITSLREFNPVTGELNSSFMGDFLWSNGNAAEIQPGVMTLLTWSVNKLWGVGYSEWWSRYPASGNIGGRSYFNISIQVAPFARLPGGLSLALRFVGDWWGRIPPGVTVSLAPFSRREVYFHVLPMYFRSMRRFPQLQRQIPGFVEQTPVWCQQMCERISHIDNGAALAALWRDELKPYYCFGTAMASAANSNAQLRVQAQLSKMVGEDDANALLSNLGGEDYLTSLGPVVNLARVARGEMSREDYLDQYGHRGPDEFELARPQPIDDPTLLDQQLALYQQQPIDVEALLAKQRSNFDAAWQRFCTKYPGKIKSTQARLAEAARLARQREAARSELTRVMGVLRAFAVRAGELIGLGDNVFYLTIDELLIVLEGDATVCRYLPQRKETYARYCSLPPYPPVISGRFDPFRWAVDPDRRSDVFDAHSDLPKPTSNTISGFAGAAGEVEGVVRRIDCLEDGHLLQPGEILVTLVTNVGWTPLFPRAAAIVTDVGAPLSHAAIVARELGIPAVVGCNEATMRLKTGDRVRVNGGHGTVELLPR